MNSIRLSTAGPVFGWEAEAGEWLVLMTPNEYGKIQNMTVKDLQDGYLWRLNHNTEVGYTLTLYPGGEIKLMDGCKVVFDAKDPQVMADKMESMTIPCRINLEFNREQATALRDLVCNFKHEVDDHVAVLEKLDAALKDGMPG